MNTEENVDLRYSLGTTPVVDKILSMLNEGVTIDVILINLATIARNILTRQDLSELEKESRQQNKKFPETQALDAADKEAIEVINELATALNDTKLSKTPAIIAYIANYRENIPFPYLRPITPSRENQEKVIEGIFNRSKNLKRKVGKTTIQIIGQMRMFPYKNLSILSRSFIVQGKALMLSHIPLDYHFAHTHSPESFNIINSFTGDLLSLKDLGNKVFKTELIPFLPGTHAVLGDTEFILPLRKGIKKEMEELADQEQWLTKSNAFIEESLRNHNMRPSLRI